MGKLHVALLLVAVLVACVSAKSVRPQNKALFKKLLQKRIASASEKTEEDAGKLAQAEKLEKSWGYTGYGASYDWLCAWYPGDCELGCCRKSESETKESLSTKFGMRGEENTGGEAWAQDWACAWYPNDCAKCPSACAGSGSGSGSGSGAKEALSTKYGMVGEESPGAESWYQEEECAWYPNDCTKCPSGPKCTKNVYTPQDDVLKGLSAKRLAALEKLAERLLAEE